jgi:autotransporter-associated beta strand protein
VNYGFTTNASVPDGNGQYTTTHTLGGLSAFSNVTVNLNLTTPDNNNPMFLGDMYSTLTYGTPSESNRTAVLLNRPGRDDTNAFGSSLSSLNVTLDETASTNVWATTSSTGTYKSDGRLGVNPYGAGVAFSNGDRGNTLSALNGGSLTSNKFTLLMADTSAGGQAQLANWGMAVKGTAAASGTMSGDGGTFSITDDGGINNLGADLVTTQNGGGALNVTINGTANFSGAISGTGAFNKLGSGTLTFSGSTANTYTTLTTVSNGELDLNKTGVTAIAGNVLVNGGTLKWVTSATANQIATSKSINMTSGAVDLNGATQTLVDFTNSGGTFTTGTGSLTGTGASMTWSGGTNTINAGGSVNDPHVTISGGTNTIESTGLLTINTGTGLVMSGGTLTLNAGTNATNGGKVLLMGSGTNNIAASAGTTSNISSSSSTNPGLIDLANASKSIFTDTGATLNVSANITSTGSLTKTGTGTLNLTGANTYTGTTTVGSAAAGAANIASSIANGGTLNAAATGALGSGGTYTSPGVVGTAGSGTTSITVNNGGTLLLTNNAVTDRVSNTASISLGTSGGTGVGGTIARSGAGTVSEGAAVSTTNGGASFTGGPSAVGLGALTLNSNSTLDFGTGGVGTLVFASFIPAGQVLNILNWTSNASGPAGVSGVDGTDDRLVFATDQTSNLSGFSFGGISAMEIALGDGFFEITPIPEPGTWATGALAFAGLLLTQRRRFKKLVSN